MEKDRDETRLERKFQMAAGLGRDIPKDPRQETDLQLGEEGGDTEMEGEEVPETAVLGAR